MKKQITSVIIQGFLAGVLIGMGGLLYIKTREYTGNIVIAAFLYGISMVFISYFNFFLYTNKVCVLFDEWKRKGRLHISIRLVLGYLANVLGAYVIALLFKIAIDMPDFVQDLSDIRLNAEWYELIVRGFLCGLLIYFGGKAYNKFTNDLPKLVIIFLCVGCYITCGFDNSIVIAFYFSFLDNIFVSIPSLLLITLGNALGGLVIPALDIVLTKFNEL